MSGYYRKRFPVPTVHSIAPTSPTMEANTIESYFTNNPFFEAPCTMEINWIELNRRPARAMVHWGQTLNHSTSRDLLSSFQPMMKRDIRSELDLNKPKWLHSDDFMLFSLQLTVNQKVCTKTLWTIFFLLLCSSFSMDKIKQILVKI